MLLWVSKDIIFLEVHIHAPFTLSGKDEQHCVCDMVMHSFSGLSEIGTAVGVVMVVCVVVIATIIIIVLCWWR